jgi:hypothetical protein
MATSPAKKVIDENRGKVAPFVTNQVSLHDHQPQKIDGKTYNFSASQIPNLDCPVATMTIPLQVAVFTVKLCFVGHEKKVFLYISMCQAHVIFHVFYCMNDRDKWVHLCVFGMNWRLLIKTP